MKIIYSPRFKKALRLIKVFIATDSVFRANSFIKNLKNEIDNIKEMPYRHKRSEYFDDDNTREMVYKGYSIVFFVDEETETILILGIKKYKENY